MIVFREEVKILSVIYVSLYLDINPDLPGGWIHGVLGLCLLTAYSPQREHYLLATRPLRLMCVNTLGVCVSVCVCVKHGNMMRAKVGGQSLVEKKHVCVFTHVHETQKYSP